MGHDLVGQVDTGGVLNERKAGLAAARVSPDGDVGFEVGDTAIGAVVRLFGDGDEEEIHRVDEPLRASWTTRLDEAAKEPIPCRRRQCRRRAEERQSKKRRTTWTSGPQACPSESGWDRGRRQYSTPAFPTCLSRRIRPTSRPC